MHVPVTTSSEAQDPADLGELSAAWNTGSPEYLSVRIGLVAKLIERHTARLLSEQFGMTLAEWRVLAQLARVGPLTVRSLAEYSWVDRAEVSRAAGCLIAKRLVAQMPNPADRRSPYFVCSAAGQRLYRRIRPTRDAFQQLLQGKIPAAQREAFLEVLYRISRSLAPGVSRGAPPAQKPRPRSTRNTRRSRTGAKPA